MAESAKYPRGVPFRSPQEEMPEVRRPVRNGPGLPQASTDDLEALESRMRQRLLIMACGAVAVLVVALGAGFHFMSQAVHRAELSANAARADRPAEKPPAPLSVTPAASELRSVLTLPKDALTGAARDRTLEALGGLTATHLYQSYLNIGFLADAAENDVYAPVEAKKLLTTILSLIDTVDQQLARLPEAALDADDARKLARMRQIVSLLRAQGKELRACWDTPEADARKDRETRFHKAREEAWAGIKELLDISD